MTDPTDLSHTRLAATRRAAASRADDRGRAGRRRVAQQARFGQLAQRGRDCGGDARPPALGGSKSSARSAGSGSVRTSTLWTGVSPLSRR